jgi:type VI secretion system protein ImpM
MPSKPPGFYGKVPDFGDFLTRRLPPAFIDVWDPWLRLLLQASRDALGEAWLAAWLSAPVWHFGLGQNLLGDQAWGVLIPSLDRVGRHFPFTIVGLASPQGRPLRDWALAAESLALTALDEGFSPETLEHALATLGPPAPRVPGAGPASLPLPQNPGDWPNLVETAPAPAADETLWWCRGANHVAPTLLRCIGLPTATLAASMIGIKEGQGSALDPLGPSRLGVLRTTAPDPI